MTGRRRPHRAGISIKERVSSRRGPKALAVPMIVVVVVAVLAVGVIASSQMVPSPVVTAPGVAAGSMVTALPQATLAPPYPDVPRVTLLETVDKLDRGRAILIDVRGRSAYEKAHAAGAFSFPEAEIVARVDELPSDREWILYCT